MKFQISQRDPLPMMEQPGPLSPPHVPSLPYAALDQTIRDREHLRTLAICHYVYGALLIFFSSFGLIHLVMGIGLVSGRIQFPASPTTAPAGAVNPVQFMPWFFIAFGGCFVLGGWTLGILTIFSGVSMKRRRYRIFTMIIAGINCMSVPLGTTLGVFTFIVLLRDSVRELYDHSAAALWSQTGGNR